VVNTVRGEVVLQVKVGITQIIGDKFFGLALVTICCSIKAGMNVNIKVLICPFKRISGKVHSNLRVKAIVGTEFNVLDSIIVLWVF
jgi:hypothetical protein